MTLVIPPRVAAAPALLALLVLSACARSVVSSPPAAPAPAYVGLEEAGLASWYGHPYHGRRTASGEVYDMRELTAAHRTLPLGSWLMVTNLDNGQAVQVRLNDRGPFIDGRILDLSYAAAAVLGAVGPGVVPVKLRVMALPGGSAPTSDGGPFSIQLGAFTSRARADSLRLALEQGGEQPTLSEAVVAGETFYRVRVGPYADRPGAETAAQGLAARGYLAVVVPAR